MNETRILVVEDDPYISEIIRLYCEKEGYRVTLARDGLEGLHQWEQEGPDLVLLDIMLPEMDGWELCGTIRKESDVPVIMLTGKGESYDKLRGFDLGADDYIVKPFDPKELMARIRAVLRRTRPGNADCVEIAGLTVNMAQYEVVVREKAMTLPPKEMELLFFLVYHANRVFTRQQLLDRIWGLDFDGDPRTVDVHIKRIREKLGHQAEWRIRTIRGIGYQVRGE